MTIRIHKTMAELQKQLCYREPPRSDDTPPPSYPGAAKDRDKAKRPPLNNVVTTYDDDVKEPTTKAVWAQAT